jgi:hypothetical protein
MIVVRHTNQARYGMGDQLVQLTKEMLTVLAKDKRLAGIRILTDISGPAFTVEAEFQVQSLAVYEQIQSELVMGGAFATWFGRVQPLVESGHRDFFALVV